MGRKPKTLTPDQLNEVETLAALLTTEQISDYFGITRVTFNAMMEREPDIAIRYKKGKARAIGTVARGLLQQAREGNLTAQMFYLKTQAGWREKDRIDEATSTGTTITIIRAKKPDADSTD